MRCGCIIKVKIGFFCDNVGFIVVVFWIFIDGCGILFLVVDVIDMWRNIRISFSNFVIGGICYGGIIVGSLV